MSKLPSTFLTMNLLDQIVQICEDMGVTKLEASNQLICLNS